MKIKKHINILLTIFILLSFYGCSSLKKPNVTKEISEKTVSEDIEKTTQEKKYTKEEIIKEPEEVKNEGEWLYSEDLEAEYPERPIESGYQIEIPEGIELPADNLLTNLYTYKFHTSIPYDVYYEGFDEETQTNKKYEKVIDKQNKKEADRLANILIKKYFAKGTHWKKREIVTGYLSKGCRYLIQGKEKNEFQYWWTTYNGNGKPEQIIAEPGMIPVPEPKDNDWDQAFQEFSLSLLNSFQLGLWDGKSCNMGLSYKENVSGKKGSYRYMIELDGNIGTNHTPTLGNSCRFGYVSFQYQDGSLISMYIDETPFIFDGKKQIKLNYKNMEEAFDTLKQKLVDYCKEYKNKYFCIKFDKINIEYIINSLDKSFTPILSAHVKWWEYDFKNINKWIWEDPDPEHEFGCFLCLDTEEFYPSLIKKTFLWESFNIYKGE